jgi:hypothetical protein
MLLMRTLLGKIGGATAFVLAVALSIGLNAYLTGTRLLSHSEETAKLKVNSTLPVALLLQDVDGKKVSLQFANDPRPTVLYVLSPLCGWCKRNEPNVRTLAAATGSRFRYVGLSIETRDLKKYIAEGHAPFPVYLIPSKDLIRSLGLSGTPETIVVSPTAKVEQLWEGAYLDTNRLQVEKFFGVKLPGLSRVATISD